MLNPNLNPESKPQDVETRGVRAATGSVSLMNLRAICSFTASGLLPRFILSDSIVLIVWFEFV